VNAEIALFWDKLKSKAGRFPPEAFCFVQEGLRFTVDKLYEPQDAESEGGRHVSGQELCLGLRDFAIQQYGLLARTVLGSWGVNRTEDFGKLVFIMVQAELMKKTDEDSIEDFQGVYDFDEVFAQELELA
jgi:uncharacterized repeat protein (TIGR04138 family)